MQVQFLTQTSLEHIRELVDATNGHTLENIRAIMEHMPSGSEVAGETICDVDGGLTYSLKPIVKWIEGSAITDEMVRKAGGRVPCMVRDFENDEWEPDLLYEIDLSKKYSFLCKEDCWINCRVKATDLGSQGGSHLEEEAPPCK